MIKPNNGVMQTNGKGLVTLDLLVLWQSMGRVRQLREPPLCIAMATIESALQPAVRCLEPRTQKEESSICVSRSVKTCVHHFVLYRDLFLINNLWLTLKLYYHLLDRAVSNHCGIANSPSTDLVS